MMFTFEFGFWLGYGVGGHVGALIVYFICKHIAVKRGCWDLLKDNKVKGKGE